MLTRAFRPLKGYLLTKACHLSYSTDLHDLKMEKVLLLSKLTRLEYERMINPGLSEDQLKKRLSNKGSNYDWLKVRHEEHHKRQCIIAEALNKRNVQVKVVTKSKYDDELVDWADIIFTAGGDGTFLLASSRILSNDKPILGLNTDPICSEGYLCLPNKYMHNVDLLLDRLVNRDFEWLMRQRIRVALKMSTEAMNEHTQHQDGVNLEPLESFYTKQLEQRYMEHLSHADEPRLSSVELPRPYTKTLDIRQSVHNQKEVILPIRALNEVYLGESHSARVSYYEVSIDGSSGNKQKSSGFTVYTGTGSSSWSFHISSLSSRSMGEILQILAKHRPNLAQDPEFNSEAFARQISAEYNDQLKYDPCDVRMAFTVRDPVRNGVFKAERVRGYANNILIRSRMTDAHLVLDGGSSFLFNDGAVASISVHPEDALRCVSLPDH